MLTGNLMKGDGGNPQKKITTFPYCMGTRSGVSSQCKGILEEKQNIQNTLTPQYDNAIEEYSQACQKDIPAWYMAFFGCWFECNGNCYPNSINISGKRILKFFHCGMSVNEKAANIKKNGDIKNWCANPRIFFRPDLHFRLFRQKQRRFPEFALSSHTWFYIPLLRAVLTITKKPLVWSGFLESCGGTNYSRTSVLKYPMVE